MVSNIIYQLLNYFRQPFGSEMAHLDGYIIIYYDTTHILNIIYRLQNYSRKSFEPDMAHLEGLTMIYQFYCNI